MSATELIEQLKALPASEREAFARLFQELRTSTAQKAGSGGVGSGSGDWPDFGERLKQIYGDKVVADSESVISYARGDC